MVTVDLIRFWSLYKHNTQVSLCILVVSNKCDFVICIKFKKSWIYKFIVISNKIYIHISEYCHLSLKTGLASVCKQYGEPRWATHLARAWGSEFFWKSKCSTCLNWPQLIQAKLPAPWVSSIPASFQSPQSLRKYSWPAEGTGVFWQPTCRSALYFPL